MLHGHRRVHLMQASRQARQHGGGVLTIGRLAEDGALQFDHGIRTQHRKAQQAAQFHGTPAAGGLFDRHALREIGRRLAGMRNFDDVDAADDAPQRQHVEGNSDLLQQFAPARRLRSQVDAFINQHILVMPLNPDGRDAP